MEMKYKKWYLNFFIQKMSLIESQLLIRKRLNVHPIIKVYETNKIKRQKAKKERKFPIKDREKTEEIYRKVFGPNDI